MGKGNGVENMQLYLTGLSGLCHLHVQPSKGYRFALRIEMVVSLVALTMIAPMSGMVVMSGQPILVGG